MAPVKYFLNALLGAVIFGSTFAVFPAYGNGTDQLDEDDRQEFNTKIVRASACTKARDFECAAKELSQAKKFVNGSRDRTILQKAAESLELERQFAIRDDAKRKYSNERSTVEANADNAEKELAESRRANIANGQAEIRRADAARERQRAEERQSPQVASESIGAQIIRMGNENTAILGNIDRQTNAAYAETNRRLAAQAAERERARAEQNEREAERRRDAERNRADAQRTAQVQDRNDANARNQREADAARVQQERERQQNQVRQQEQERQQNLARQQEQVRQKADAQAAQQAEKLAAEQYLRAMQNGIRLGVKNCYGQYEVGGNKPDIKPEVVSCIDVHYRARCEGSPVNYDGVHKSFTGFDAGCFGDTATISPKPACPANQVHVEVVAVRACGG